MRKHSAVLRYLKSPLRGGLGSSVWPWGKPGTRGPGGCHVSLPTSCFVYCRAPGLGSVPRFYESLDKYLWEGGRRGNFQQERWSAHQRLKGPLLRRRERCDRLNCAPPPTIKRVCGCSNPQSVTLPAGSAVADVTRVKMRSCWSRGAPPAKKTRVLRRKKPGEGRVTREWHVTSKAKLEPWGCKPRNPRNCQGSTRSLKRQDIFSPPPSEGVWPCHCMISEFQTPEPAENVFLLFEVTLFAVP